MIEIDYKSTLAEIVQDMRDWPQNELVVLHSVKLIAVEQNRSEKWDRAEVLVHSTDESEGTWWTLMRLHRRNLPYFKREIWFYEIAPDGPEAPYEGHRAEPSAEIISKFESNNRLDVPVTNCIWTKDADLAI